MTILSPRNQNRGKIMARHLIIGLAASGLIVGPALGQESTPRTPSITVVGVGTIKSPPDVARLSFDLRGEGKTADAATQALVDRQKAITDGLLALAGSAPIAIHTSDVKVEASRSPDCKADRYDGGPQLSAGACAIAGYVASESISVRTRDIRNAGTAVGLAGRLGADDASIEGYDVEDLAAARQQATAKALADARSQASAIAGGAGTELGPLLSVRNEDATPALDEVIVTGAHTPPPAVSPPPIAVTTLPQPIETTVRLAVSYAIGSQR
jgi:uncharacterized protein YggE